MKKTINNLQTIVLASAISASMLFLLVMDPKHNLFNNATPTTVLMMGTFHGETEL
jgi:hypothetical protein